MTVILWAALGGLLGALFRCFTVPGIDAQLWPFRFGREALRKTVGSTVSMAAIGLIVQFVPVDKLAPVLDAWFSGASKLLAVLTQPGSAAIAGLILAYAGLDFIREITELLRRWRMANGNDAAKVGVFLLLAVGLAGCGALGLQSASVSFPRDDVLLLYADLKADWREGVALLSRECVAKAIPAETCTRLAALRDRFHEADQVFQAGVRAKRDVSLQDLQGVLTLVSQLGRLAGFPVPALGAPR